jgi:hypothetical protein
MEISRWYAEQYNASVCLVKKKQDLATYYYELHTIMPTAKNLPAATGPHLPGNLGGGAGEWATTLSLQITGQRAGSVRLVEKLCPFYLLDIHNHSWRASGQEGPRGIGSGCEAHSARTRHNTNCIKQGHKTSARLLPLESPARGCSGSKCFCAPGFAVQERSSRAPSPASPRHKRHGQRPKRTRKKK